MLLLTDRIDEWLMASLGSYKDKEIINVTKDNILDNEKPKKVSDSDKDTLDKIKSYLGDRVSDVIASSRLTDSASCLVLSKNDPGAQLKKILEAAGQDVQDTSPIFEINTKHKLYKKLLDLKGKQFNAFIDFLYDYAVIAEGGSPKDPAKYLRQLDKYLVIVMSSLKISVLGGGSFGTVLANLAASNGYNVSLWVRDADQALRINSEGANTSYHPELQLSENIFASDNLQDVVSESSIIFIATPSIIFETIVQRIRPYIEPNMHVVSCTKGIKPEPFRTMTDIIKLNLDNTSSIGVLSGPNLAREIAENKAAGTVIASKSSELINLSKEAFSSNTFKVYSSNDIEGVELAGALKNIYAIVCGMAEAIDVGENAIGFNINKKYGRDE